MLQHLGLAWTAWKLSAKRLGPIGGALFAGGVVVAYVLVSEYLKDRRPKLASAIERAV